MKLQQLLYLAKIVEHDMNISEAARALHTSQSGVSRYIGLLEKELGVALFVREKKKLLRLTPAGLAIHAVATRMLSDAGALRTIAREADAGESGDLTVATAHTHARYTLPAVVSEFKKRFPKSGLRIRQGYLGQIIRWTMEGSADVYVGTAPNVPVEGLTLLACDQLRRIIIAPPRHPLLRAGTLTLADIAKFPIITYDEESAARSQVMGAFHRAQLKPNIVLSATDIDVMKTYVRLGLGIAIVAHVAYERRQDIGLRAIDVAHLFEPSTVNVGFRTDAYMTRQMRHFIALYAPRVTGRMVGQSGPPRGPGAA